MDEETGKLYVIDTSDGLVNRYDAEGVPDGLQLTATGMSFEGGPRSCDAIAVDNSGAATKGNVYIVSGADNELFAFGKEGKFLWRYQASKPCGVSVDRAGHVWLSNEEYEEHPEGLQQINPTDGSKLEARPGVSRSGQIGFDSKDDFVVVDQETKGINKLSPTEEPLWSYTGIALTASLTVDSSSDRIYAISRRFPRGVFLLASDGTPLTGSEPFGEETFSQIGVAADAAHRRLFLSSESGNIFVFDIRELPLTVTQTGSGSGVVTCNEGSCPSSYYAKREVTLVASPMPDSQFTGWNVNGSSSACPGTGPCTLTMEEGTTIEANFLRVEHQLTVSESGPGEVTSIPSAIDCGATCEARLGQNEFFVLTAIPAAHYHFVGWTGCDEVEAGECYVLMTSDKSVSVEFAPTMHKLTIDVAGSGKGAVSCQVDVEPAGPCAAEYEDGTVVTLTGMATSPGSTFVGFSGGGCSGSGPCVVTLDGDTSVTATFDPVPGEKPAEKAKSPVEVRAGKPAGKSTVKRLTREQMLARAIRRCRKLPKRRRAACVKRTRMKYAPQRHKKRK